MSSRYAVVGHPVEHSQSPFIHAEFARLSGERLSYERLPCPPDALAATLLRFAATGASGCNVTLPFKFEAFRLAASATPRAHLAEACNTLRFDRSGWFGDNTDGCGLVRDIEVNAGRSLRSARILLIGAGGAAAGCLGALLERGAREIVVANRTPSRAAAMVDRHRTAAAGEAATALRAAPLDACGEKFDVVVNASTSSLGAAPPPVAGSVLQPGTLAVDLMYGPAARPFLAWAAQHGAEARDGLGMLVEQAAEAFWVWRGVRPPTDTVLAALRRRLEAS